MATGRGNSVVVGDTQTLQPVAHRCRRTPLGHRLTRGGRKVYAANSLSNTISVIDTATDRVTRTIPAGDGPWGMATLATDVHTGKAAP